MQASEEIQQLREQLSTQERLKDEEILELDEKLASLNFQLEQAKTRLKNQHISEIRAPTESVQMKNIPEKPVPRENASVLPRSIPVPVGKQLPKWTSFVFVTKKKGAKGPTKSESIGYYSEK